jgi:hypothetical protein
MRINKKEKKKNNYNIADPKKEEGKKKIPKAK